MTGPGLLDDLTTQLTDFLGLPADLDLPKLWHVKLERTYDQPGWTVEAQLTRYHGPSVWDAVHDWHVATGGTVTVGEPSNYKSTKPWRTVAVTVSHVGLEVRVWGHVDASDPIPDWAQPKPTPELPAEYGECLDERMVPDADAQAEADVAAAVNLVPVDVDPRVLDDIESLDADPEAVA